MRIEQSGTAQGARGRDAVAARITHARPPIPTQGRPDPRAQLAQLAQQANAGAFLLVTEGMPSCASFPSVAQLGIPFPTWVNGRNSACRASCANSEAGLQRFGETTIIESPDLLRQ